MSIELNVDVKANEEKINEVKKQLSGIFTEAANNAKTSTVEMGDNVDKAIQGIMTAWDKTITAGFAGTKKSLDGAISDSIAPLFQGEMDKVEKIWDTAWSSMQKSLSGIFTGMLKDLTSGITSFLGNVANDIVLTPVKDWFVDLTGMGSLIKDPAGTIKDYWALAPVPALALPRIAHGFPASLRFLIPARRQRLPLKTLGSLACRPFSILARHRRLLPTTPGFLAFLRSSIPVRHQHSKPARPPAKASSQVSNPAWPPLGHARVGGGSGFELLNRAMGPRAGGGGLRTPSAPPSADRAGRPHQASAREYIQADMTSWPGRRGLQRVTR